MKRIYHICLSSDDEVLFRDLEDYNRGFNCFAIALFRTSSTGLVESFMSTHCHLLVQTDDPRQTMYHFRNSYSKYFNYKYHRDGRLGETRHFVLEVAGHHHLLAAISYILRNALHHGVSPIPFAYPHSTANSIFRKEMGKFFSEPLLPRRSLYAKFVGRSVEYPDSYKMTASGLFLRESVLDIPYVENLFVTPRAFSYYMTRKSSEEWDSEQTKDNNGSEPINLSKIESGVNMNTLNRMYMYENGKADYRKLNDIDLCMELDTIVKSQYGKDSVYCLSDTEKRSIARYLYKERYISESQIRRCLVL